VTRIFSRPPWIALFLAVLLGALTLPTSALAATVELRALLDLDNDASTGCTVMTVDGDFTGVEQILTTTVETLPPPGEVTGLVRQECDAMAGTFGAPIVVDSLMTPPWPVGLGNGTLGSDVLETYFPLALVGAQLPVRIGLESDDLNGNHDALLDLVLSIAAVPNIPTLSTWALLALALLLAGSALALLRRRGALLLVLLAAGSVAGAVYAVCVLDGEVDDWMGVAALGNDPVGDAPADTDIVALFARADGSELCLRYDVEINQPPVASADNFATDEDTPLNVMAPGVLLNDSDPNGDPLTAVLDTAPPGAEVSAFSLNPDGSFSLTPAADFNGATSFTYHANDGSLASNVVTVTVTVGPLPDGPMAVDDGFATDEDTPLNIVAPGVLNNDVDPENDPLQVTASSTTSAQGATVTVMTDGSFTYDPTGAVNLQNLAAGAMLDDTFTYTVEDNPSSGSDVGTVTVTVTGVDDPPTAVDDTATVLEDSMATTIDVLANDTDIDGGLLQIASITQPTNGTVVNNTTDLTYQPNLDYCNDPPGTSTDDFTYTVNGGSTATVRVTVICVDDPGVAVTDTYRTVGNTLLEVSGSQAQPLPSIFVLGSVLTNDSDPDNALSVTGTVNITAGAVVSMNADGTFTYVPPPGLHGDGNPATADDTFQYQLSGGELGTVQIDIDGFVWYVDNTANGGTPNTGVGTSVDRFSTLSDGNANVTADDAEDASIAGDFVYVFQGDGTNTNQDDGFAIKNGQKLLGEGVDLVVDVNGTPTTLFTGNVANKPLHQPTSGVAVAFNNSSGEVAGLDIRGGNGITVVPGAGGSVLIRDNAITGLGGLTGLLVNHNFANTQTLTVLRNTIGGAIGVDVTNTSGTLHVVFDQNTGLESTDGGATAAASFAAPGGQLVMTSFNANQVAGTTATAGLIFDGVVFDANPADPDFTGDEVAAGNTSVGSNANPVSGSALVLTNVAGDLAFGTLDLFTDGVGAVGLAATGNGTLNAVAGTGFEITSTSGTINSANGPAVNLDPLTAGLVFSSVSSGSSPMGVHAIRLHDLAGSFTATGGTLANTLGSAIRVTGTNPGDSTIVVNLSNMTINHTAGLTPVIFGQRSTGLFSLTGSTISKGGGRVIDFDDMDGGSNFTGTTVSTTNHHGKRIINSAGIHNLPNIQITTAPPAGVDALDLENNVGATINVPRLEVTTNGSRGIFANNGGTLNVTGATNQITTTGHSAIEMTNTTVGANGITFASLSATSTGANEGLDLDGVGGGTFNVTGTTTVNGTGGASNGIDIATSGATFTFTSLDIDNTGGAGVSLTNNTGPVSLNGGNITGAAGAAFDVNGGTHNVTYAGTINNTAGKSVEITGRATAGRTVSLSNNITHTGNAIGIDVNGNSNGTTLFSGGTKTVSSGTQAAVTLANNTGHVIQLTNGGLDIDATSGAGFTATGGGTVEVSGAANTVNTTTGIGVNVASTAIGGGGMTWRSVSVNGAPKGIALNDAGTGGFTVTGVATTDGTGGTIQNITNRGVEVISTDNISLSNMNLTDAATTNGVDPTNANGTCGGLALGQNLGCNASVHLQTVNGAILDNVDILRSAQIGINGHTVTDFALRNSTVTDAGNQTNEFSLKFRDMLGTSDITNSTIRRTLSGGTEVDQLRLQNFSATPLTLMVVNSHFDTNAADGPTSAFENTGFIAVGHSGANMRIEVIGSFFENNKGPGLTVGVSDGTSNANVDLIVAGGTFRNNNVGLEAIGHGTNATIGFDIDGAIVDDNPAAGINIDLNSSSAAGVTLQGHVRNNNVTHTGAGDCIQVNTRGAGTAIVAITGNTLNESGFERAIDVSTQEGSGDLDVIIEGNTLNMTGPNPVRAMNVNSGAAAGDSGTMCAKVGGATMAEKNTVNVISGGDNRVRVRRRENTAVNLQGVPGPHPQTNQATIEAYITSQNTGAVGQATVGAGFGDATCTVPPLP